MNGWLKNEVAFYKCNLISIVKLAPNGCLSFLIHQVFAEVPPCVEYMLIETGKSLEPILDALREWEESYRLSHSSYELRKVK